MKIEIEIDDGIIENIYEEFCEWYGFVPNEELDIAVKAACLKLLVEEISENGADDSASLVEPDMVKYELGSELFRELQNGD